MAPGWVGSITVCAKANKASREPFTGNTCVAASSFKPRGVKFGTYSTTLNLLLATTYGSAFLTANGNSVPVARNAFLAALAGNKAYLNIHTTAFPGGEIRGFFMQQVPSPLPVLGIGAALAWSRRLRRRLAANAT